MMKFQVGLANFFAGVRWVEHALEHRRRQTELPIATSIMLNDVKSGVSAHPQLEESFSWQSRAKGDFNEALDDEVAASKRASTFALRFLPMRIKTINNDAPDPEFCQRIRHKSIHQYVGERPQRQQDYRQFNGVSRSDELETQCISPPQRQAASKTQ